MAEGMARLNQHVVSTDYWDDRPERLVPIEGALPRGSKDPEQGNRPVSLDDIRGAVEADIIPRLVPGRDQSDVSSGKGRAALAEADIQHFSSLLLGAGDDSVISAYLDDIQARGLPIDLIYLDLFQPAARHIGELWVDDHCTFVDVTLAIGTMQRCMRALGSEFHRAGRHASGSRLALLTPLPDDQHTFGLAMVAEFLRRSGWTVCTSPVASINELKDLVRSSSFAVVGFSASRDDRLEELAEAIRQVRGCSMNGEVGILVGGPAFLNCPSIAGRIGADAVSYNAIEAVAQAEAFAASATGP